MAQEAYVRPRGASVDAVIGPHWIVRHFALLGVSNEDSSEVRRDKTVTIHVNLAVTVVLLLNVMAWSSRAAIIAYCVSHIALLSCCLVPFVASKMHSPLRIFSAIAGLGYTAAFFLSEGCYPLRNSHGRLPIVLLPTFLFHSSMGGSTIASVLVCACNVALYIIMSVVEASNVTCYSPSTPKVTDTYGLIFVQVMMPVLFVWFLASALFADLKRMDSENSIVEDFAKHIADELPKYPQQAQGLMELASKQANPINTIDDTLLLCVDMLLAAREMIPTQLLKADDITPVRPPSNNATPVSGFIRPPEDTAPFKSPSEDGLENNTSGPQSDPNALLVPQKHDGDKMSTSTTSDPEAQAPQRPPRRRSMRIAIAVPSNGEAEALADTASSVVGAGSLRRRASMTKAKPTLSQSASFIVAIALPWFQNYACKKQCNLDLMRIVLSEYVDNIRTAAAHYEGTILWGSFTTFYLRFNDCALACGASLCFLDLMRKDANHHKDAALNETRAHIPCVAVVHAHLLNGVVGSENSSMASIGYSPADAVLDKVLNVASKTALPAVIIAHSFVPLINDQFEISPGPHSSLMVINAARNTTPDGLPLVSPLTIELSLDSLLPLPDVDDMLTDMATGIVQQGKSVNEQMNLAATYSSLGASSKMMMSKSGKKRLPPEVLDCWYKFDVDRNGTLDEDEVKEVIAEIGIQMTDDELKAFFKQIDTDQSGSVSQEEFARAFFSAALGGSNIMSNIRRAAVAMARNTGADNLPIVLNAWKKYDKDASGALEAHEIACILKDLGMTYNEEEVDWLVTKMDKNGNGMVEFDEFVALFSEEDVATTKVNSVKERIQTVTRVLANKSNQKVYTNPDQTLRDNLLALGDFVERYYVFFLFLYTLYNSGVVSYRVALGDLLSVSHTVIIIDMVIDLIFIAWFVLKLCWIPREVKGQVLFHKKEVFLEYFKSVEFWVDLIIVLPADFLYFAFGSHNGGVIAYYRVNKILTMYHIQDLFSKLTRTFNPVAVRVANAIFWFLIFAHVLACAVCIEAIKLGDSVMSDYTTIAAVIGHKTEVLRYTRALYWGIVTLGGQLVGTTVPPLDEQLYLSIIAVLMGLPLYTIVLGTVGAAISSENSESKFLAKLDELRGFFSYTKLPEHFESECLAFYRHVFNTTGSLDIADNPLEDLPVELSIQVTVEIGREMLKKVPIFANACENLQFVHELTTKLVPLVIEPNQRVMKKGERGTNMYFITFGSFNIVIDDGTVVFTLRKGNFFGEIALLHNVKRTATIDCDKLRYANVLMLEKKDFEEVTTTFPDCLSQVYKAAEDRIKQILEKEAEEAKKMKEKRKAEREARRKEKQDAGLGTVDEDNESCSTTTEEDENTKTKGNEALAQIANRMVLRTAGNTPGNSVTNPPVPNLGGSRRGSPSGLTSSQRDHRPTVALPQSQLAESQVEQQPAEHAPQGSPGPNDREASQVHPAPVIPATTGDRPYTPMTQATHSVRPNLTEEKTTQ